VNVCDRWGKTPLDEALVATRGNHSTELVDLLKRREAKTSDEMKAIAGRGVNVELTVPRPQRPKSPGFMLRTSGTHY